MVDNSMRNEAFAIVDDNLEIGHPFGLLAALSRAFCAVDKDDAEGKLILSGLLDKAYEVTGINYSHVFEIVLAMYVTVQEKEQTNDLELD